MATAVSGCGELVTSHKFLRSGASKNQRDSRRYRKRSPSSHHIDFVRTTAEVGYADTRPALLSRVNKQSSALVSKGLKSRSSILP